MIEYVNLINDIMQNGIEKSDRTGIGSRSIIGAQMKTDLATRFPALNVRRVAPRIAFEELMFMLNGKTQTKELEAKNINIWRGNTSKEFQSFVGLDYLEEGDFGRMYGVQMRKFGETPEYEGFDQLKYIVDELKNNKYSRRTIITQYNPLDKDKGVLFPCHIMIDFIITENQLNCVYWMRSSDTIYGLPYNHMYYAFFTNLLAKYLGFELGTLVYQAGDAHIYKNQYNMAEGLVNRAQAGCLYGKQKPTISLDAPINSLDDLLNYKWEDVTMCGYKPMPDFKDKPAMAISAQVLEAMSFLS